MSKQWFVTMEPLAEKALEAVKKGELTIMPERFEKVINILFPLYLGLKNFKTEFKYKICIFW